jgi:pyridoxine/pyridoxamine 5'-phosphate oxidase
MLNQIFKETINELKFGYLKRKHPNKYCYLASISHGKPVNRTVVLRDITDENNLIFFTDLRSNKVEHFHQNPNAEALFYNPKKLWQIKVSGQIQFLEDEDKLKFYRQKVQGASKKDYTTLQPPGSIINNPDAVEYQEELNFAVLELQTEIIESLQLKRPNHIRCKFKKTSNWSGEFMVP